MQRSDMDAGDMAQQVAALKQDLELLCMVREDVRAAERGMLERARRSPYPVTVPHFAYTEPRIFAACEATGKQPLPAIELPLPLGLHGVLLPLLPSDFHRVESSADVDTAFASCADAGKRHIAYDYVSPGGAALRRCRERPATFEEYARERPAHSLWLLFCQMERPSIVLGQQQAFASYLTQVGYIGKVWRPASTIQLNLYTTVNTTHIRFDAACRRSAGHSSTCWAHSCCVCGLGPDDARALLREPGRTQLC